VLGKIERQADRSPSITFIEGGNRPNLPYFLNYQLATFVLIGSNISKIFFNISDLYAVIGLSNFCLPTDVKVLGLCALTSIRFVRVLAAFSSMTTGVGFIRGILLPP